MKNLVIAFLLLALPSLLFAQKTLEPVQYISPELSPEIEKEINRQTELLGKMDNLTKEESEELDELLGIYGETVENMWDIIGAGCSWYCGGGNYKVKASSELADQGNNNYSAKSANDLSYKTAWVEGKEDEGIGEFIEYYFQNKSPRITHIIVSNGYMKSDKAWKNNNRVKALRLYVNGQPTNILNLADTKTDQVFEVGTLGHNPDGSDLVLKFEILEVYKGAKYNDTAITEIHFDGIDVH